SYHFRNPHMGELVIYYDNQNKYIFSRVASSSQTGIYIRGDAWDINVPSVFVSKNKIVGRILLNPLLPVLYFGVVIIIPFVITFLSFFYPRKKWDLNRYKNINE
ncbi:MAG: hypothetical protein ACPLW7_00200, partial [Minisyncoccia bacterium]